MSNEAKNFRDECDEYAAEYFPGAGERSARTLLAMIVRGLYDRGHPAAPRDALRIVLLDPASLRDFLSSGSENPTQQVLLDDQYLQGLSLRQIADALTGQQSLAV